jgi:hypothetical protein
MDAGGDIPAVKVNPALYHVFKKDKETINAIFNKNIYRFSCNMVINVLPLHRQINNTRHEIERTKQVGGKRGLEIHLPRCHEPPVL